MDQWKSHKADTEWRQWRWTPGRRASRRTRLSWSGRCEYPARRRHARGKRALREQRQSIQRSSTTQQV